MFVLGPTHDAQTKHESEVIEDLIERAGCLK